MAIATLSPVHCFVQGPKVDAPERLAHLHRRASHARSVTAVAAKKGKLKYVSSQPIVAEPVIVSLASRDDTWRLQPVIELLRAGGVRVLNSPGILGAAAPFGSRAYTAPIAAFPSRLGFCVCNVAQGLVEEKSGGLLRPPPWPPALPASSRLQVGIVPTDTLPAVVCDLENRAAVLRLYAIMELDPKKQLSILCRWARARAQA